MYLDPRRALPSDVEGMCDLIGLGAAIENIRIAASQSGYLMSAEYSQSNRDDILKGVDAAVRLNFCEGGKPDSLFPYLSERGTCRRCYAACAVSEDVRNACGDVIHNFPNVQLSWIVDRASIKKFSKLVGITDCIRFGYEPFHREVFRQLRFSATESDATRDGLDIRTLALPPGSALILKWLRPWSRMQWLLRLGLGRLLSVPSTHSVRRSGAIGVLTVSTPTLSNCLDGGRAFERIWLEVQSNGLQLHPLGSLPVFIAHLQCLHGRKLSDAHIHELRGVVDRLQKLSPETVGRTVLMVFRVGESKPLAIHSLRRAAEDVFQLGACVLS
jgi:hypothetical protein